MNAGHGRKELADAAAIQILLKEPLIRGDSEELDQSGPGVGHRRVARVLRPGCSRRPRDGRPVSTAGGSIRLQGAKGGVVVAISRELGLPVRYVGVGEKAGDLLPFNSKDFVDSLFA